MSGGQPPRPSPGRARPRGQAPAHEWDAEHEVDVDLAAALVAEHFPALAGADVRHLASGWDNTVHVVDGRWAFRFPRRQVALDCQRRELAVLPGLAPHLPLPVPVPELVGPATTAFPWPFTGSRLLPGDELADSGLGDADRADVAAAVGTFLRVLHEPRLAVECGRGLPVDPLRRADPAERLRRAQRWFDRLADAGHWEPGDDVVALAREARDLPAPNAPPVLVHGDLHVRHVLVDAGTAVGVLDWGDVCLADPAVDLSLAYAAFTGAARDALLAAYGDVDRSREVRARVLALSLCAALAGSAAEQGDAAVLAEALAGLRRAVA